MGKRSKEKKLAKLEVVEAEKQAIVERRKERLGPTIRLATKFAVTLIVTVVLLVLAKYVNQHLPSIVERIRQV
ncbi:MAG TPA: hypothetical protein VMQ44_00640 [Candidatus Saccharimonadales bacterium]|nr:hypothetical protein [Candidatus Saccharimonadales bacterium]